MRFLFRPLLFSCFLSGLAGLHHVAAQEQPGTTAVLKASTQLVVVDVIVQDKDGNPIRGLGKDDFRLVEDKAPQTVRRFEEHSRADGNANLMKAPALQPGEFTDFTPLKPNAPLNILLIDLINTSVGDQVFMDHQLVEYIEHADPNARIAIVAMQPGKMTMLQGFTTDPRILKDTIENHMLVKDSPILQEIDELTHMKKKFEEGSGEDDYNLAQAEKNCHYCMHQTLGETIAEITKAQMGLTLDAFDQLARYLSTFPGRKNLIWFSGSFPLSIMPDDTLGNPFSVMGNAEEQYRRVTNTLTRAQVAVYPVDAHGIRLANVINTSQQGPQRRRSNEATYHDQRTDFENEVNEHNTMDRMADDTGGKSFYNNNGLDVAVKNALDSGGNYYTLDYSPTNHKWDSSFRSVHIELTGPSAGRKLKLIYRKGYYAEPPAKTYLGKSVTALNKADTPSTPSDAYQRWVLSRGSPAPTEILFKARVRPAAAKVEDTVASDNHIFPQTKGPFRRYSVDFAAIASNFSWQPQPDGKRECDAEFGVLVFDRDGHLQNTESKAFQLHASADEYKQMLHDGVQIHMEVSVPSKDGSYLRLAIHDLIGDKFGVVELPISVVAQLPPAPQ